MSEQYPYNSKPLSPETWPDLVDLFGKQGASSGCWCMYFRMPRKEFHSTDNEEHRKMFEQVAHSGAPAGLLAYDGEKAVGWCAIAPRTEINHPFTPSSTCISAPPQRVANYTAFKKVQFGIIFSWLLPGTEAKALQSEQWHRWHKIPTAGSSQTET